MSNTDTFIYYPPKEMTAMGANDHMTTQPESAQIPSLNGERLDGLDGAEAAFSYLSEDYNDGHITRNIGGHRLLLTSRGRRFQHLDTLLDVHASEKTPLRIADMSVVKLNGEYRQRIELAE